jgi:hypothetical protein
MADNIVDLSRAREDREHERKEQKLDSLKKRFSKALGTEEKPKKSRLKKNRKKAKSDKGRTDGW